MADIFDTIDAAPAAQKTAAQAPPQGDIFDHVAQGSAPTSNLGPDGTPILDVTAPAQQRPDGTFGPVPAHDFGSSVAEQMNNSEHPWNAAELRSAIEEDKATDAKNLPQEGTARSVMGIASPQALTDAESARQWLAARPRADYLGQNLPETMVKNAITLPLQPVLALKQLANAPDTGSAAMQLAGGVVKPLVDYTGLNDLAHLDPTFQRTRDAWMTDPAMGALALTGAAELAKPTMNAASALAGKAGGVATDALGVTTGTGADVAQSFKAGVHAGEDPSSTAFTDYYTGKKGLEDIAPVFEDALTKLQQARNEQYRQALSSVTDQTQGTELPGVLADAKRNFSSQVFTPVAENGYGVKLAPDGTLDFSRSSLKGNTAAQGDLQALHDLLQDHGTQAGDTSPMGLHLLKRQLDNFYSDQSAVKSVVTGTKNELTNGLSEAFPDYGEMNAKYGQESEMIGELQRALSMKPGAQKAPALDTALRKIGQLGRENFAFRRSLVQHLEDSTGANLLDMTAGYNMGQWLPRGGLGKLIGAGEFAALAHSGVTPTGIAAMALSSPKLVGGLMYSLGIPIGMARRIMGKLPEVKAHVDSLPIASQLTPDPELVQRPQTVLDSEQLPKVSNGSLGEVIPGDAAYQHVYDWSGKQPGGQPLPNQEALPGRPLATNLGDSLPAASAYQRSYDWTGAPSGPGGLPNQEFLPPRQSSAMQLISNAPGRTVPSIEAMTTRVPAGFNPEALPGREDNLGSMIPGGQGRLVPQKEAMGSAGSAAQQLAAAATGKTAWTNFVGSKMSQYMKEEGSHAAAMKRLSREWAAQTTK